MYRGIQTTSICNWIVTLMLHAFITPRLIVVPVVSHLYQTQHYAKLRKRQGHLHLMIVYYKLGYTSAGIP